MSTQISVHIDQRKNPAVKFEDLCPMRFPGHWEKCLACLKNTIGYTICRGLADCLDVDTMVCAVVHEDKYLSRVIFQISRQISQNKIIKIKKALNNRTGH